MNSIVPKQSEDDQLILLAAQRQLYSDAKTIQLINIILSIPVVVILSVLVLKFSDLAVVSGFYGYIVAFLGLVFFNPRQKKLQEQAAKIQQRFDCYVLQMDCSKFNIENRRDPELIYRKNKKYLRNHQNHSHLKNWYPICVAEVPIEYARLICQRTNCWWDAQLRRRYVKWVLGIMIILSVFIFVIGFINGLTLEKLLLVVLLPLAPILLFGTQQYLDNKEAAYRLDNLKQLADSYWEQAINQQLSSDEITQLSYRLQDNIYDNRSNNPLIFNKIYNRLRDEDEEQMNKVAEVLVAEYKSSIC